LHCSNLDQSAALAAAADGRRPAPAALPPAWLLDQSAHPGLSLVPAGAHRHALGGAPAQRRARVCTRADRSGGGRGDKGKDKASGLNPDKADAKKADFSAFWSMKFRNFFSKRRQYLEDAGAAGWRPQCSRPGRDTAALRTHPPTSPCTPACPALQPSLRAHRLPSCAWRRR